MSELTHEGYTIRAENNVRGFNRDYTHESPLDVNESSRNINNFPLLGSVNRQDEILAKSESDDEVLVKGTNKVGRFSKRLIKQGVYAFFASYAAYNVYELLFEYFGGTALVTNFGTVSAALAMMLPSVVYFGILLFAVSWGYNKLKR